MEIEEQTRRYPIAGAAAKTAQDFAGIAEGRPKAVQPPANFGSATGPNLLMFQPAKLWRL
jgi:hypothetical protein